MRKIILTSILFIAIYGLFPIKSYAAKCTCYSTSLKSYKCERLFPGSQSNDCSSRDCSSTVTGRSCDDNWDHCSISGGYDLTGCGGGAGWTCNSDQKVKCTYTDKTDCNLCSDSTTCDACCAGTGCGCQYDSLCVNPTNTPAPSNPTKTPTPKPTKTPTPNPSGSPTPTPACANFTDNFSGATLDTNKWTFFASTGGTYQITSGVLALKSLHGITSRTSKVDFKRNITGDFTAELTLKSITHTGSVEVEALALRAIIGGTDAVTIFRKGSYKGLVSRITKGTVHIDTSVAISTLNKDTPIKVKIQRIGSDIKTYYYKNSTSTWVLLKSYTDSHKDVTIQISSWNNSPGYPEETGKVDSFTLKDCSSSVLTPTPTATQITPTATPVPGCLCDTGDTCATVCAFDKFASPITYANPIKCSLSDSLFPTPPSDKNSWCQRNMRTKGDANGDGVIDGLDLGYYVAAVNGGKISTNVNPDFDGDGVVSNADRDIIVKTYNQ